MTAPAFLPELIFRRNGRSQCADAPAHLSFRLFAPFLDEVVPTFFRCVEQVSCDDFRPFQIRLRARCCPECVPKQSPWLTLGLRPSTVIKLVLVDGDYEGSIYNNMPFSFGKDQICVACFKPGSIARSLENMLKSEREKL